MTVGEAAMREPSWSDVQLWFETIDAIVRGLGHGLNNRALALSATIESLDPKRPVGQQVSTALRQESERLTELLRQLRVLPFTSDREPMPILLRDVLSGAVHLHRAHASVGDVPAYLEGSADTPPVLALESSLLHAALVTLTALKTFAAPHGVVRITCTGTPDQASVLFQAMRDPGDAHEPVSGETLVKPTSLAAALLGSGLLEIEQRIGPDVATMVWLMPSLKVMRRRSREASAVA
ncbi:MAG: hypothetical protein H7099_19540 [Gemmatimonadaceae bacterium]|nr:hypothetical protein [Gemmatimonadaceae bacterium]